MENKKNKKKLFAIIGASALAFILTIALSVSITLAYFGGKDTATSTVTMDTAVNVDGVAVVAANVEDALPGQKVNLGAKTKVRCGHSGAFLAAVVEASEKNGETDATNVTGIKPTEFAGWKQGTAGEKTYWFYVGTGAGAASATKPLQLQDSATTEYTLGGEVILATTLTNKVAGNVVTLKVTFVAVQGIAFKDGVAITEENLTFADVVPMVTDVLGQTA